MAPTPAEDLDDEEVLDPLTIGRRIRALRTDRGMTLEALAAELGRAPSQVLEWAVQSVAKAGLVSIIGVYPPTMDRFPIGQAMNKNLALRMGNCNHRKYIPELIALVQSGVLRPTEVLARTEPIMDAIEAYRAFDQRRPGWLKVALVTEGADGREP